MSAPLALLFVEILHCYHLKIIGISLLSLLGTSWFKRNPPWLFCNAFAFPVSSHHTLAMPASQVTHPVPREEDGADKIPAQAGLSLH